MRNYFPLFVISSLLGGALALQSPVAKADSIPTISITSATGDATWGVEHPGVVTASLSGSNFSLRFGAGWPQYAFWGTAPGDPFPDKIPLQLTTLIGATEIPSGSLTIGGTTSSVWYDGNIMVGPSTSITVPSGTATLIVPGWLGGNASACLQGFGYFCLGSSTQSPVYVAQVYFNIPGLLTVNFSPGGPYGEQFTAGFTATPEPSAWLLVLAGLGSLATRRRWLRHPAR